MLLENESKDTPIEKASSDHEELPSGDNRENLPKLDYANHDEDEVKSECGHWATFKYRSIFTCS